jgi:phosphate:Na+ symporter
VKGTLLLIELAGHVGLLLWGTHVVGTGVQRGFGTALRRWLGRNLTARLPAFLTGLGITALLQSSTATGLLATSFTATGFIDLAAALSVMLGANVGTALLTQVLSFNMGLVGPPLVLAGVLLFRWVDDGRVKNLGRVGIGLGLMLMALAGLVHTLGPVENAGAGAGRESGRCVAGTRRRLHCLRPAPAPRQPAGARCRGARRIAALARHR